MRRVILLSCSLLLAASCAPTDPPEQDAGPDRFADYGEPIDADAEEWTWVEFEDTQCGNGAPAGISVNPGATGTDVMFYLEGGGACWDQFTCDAGVASFVRSGVNSADARQWSESLGQRGIFNRDDEANPFKDYSFVYVPYCTGDVHIGSRPETPWGVAHMGYDNIGKFLHRVVPTFPEAEHVVVAGVSAGGFGAMLNYDRVRRAFIDLPADLLIDSAPPFTTTYFPIDWQNLTREAWNAEPAIPEGCGDACNDFHATFLFHLDTWPDARVGLISSLEDSTIRYFMGLAQDSGGSVSGVTYRAALGELLDTIFAVRDNTSVFYTTGADHVFLYEDPLSNTEVNGITLNDWLTQMLGDSRWGLVLPQ